MFGSKRFLHLYSYFNIENPSYIINKHLLKLNYIKCLNKIHPDNFVYTNPQLSKLSHNLTCFTNKTYNVLKDDILRAKYLLYVKNDYDLGIFSDRDYIKYVYTKDTDVNMMISQLQHLEESINLYKQYQMVYKLVETRNILRNMFILMSQKYDEELKKSNNVYLCSYYVVLLDKINQLNLLTVI
jgi:molecular chaperone HscB